jgi:hypothetical protein
MFGVAVKIMLWITIKNYFLSKLMLWVFLCFIVDLSIVLVFGPRLVQCYQFSLPVSISVGWFPASSIESAAPFFIRFSHQSVWSPPPERVYSLALEFGAIGSVVLASVPTGKIVAGFRSFVLGFYATPGLDSVAGLSFHDFSSVTRESAAACHFSVVVPGPRSRGRSSWSRHGHQAAFTFWFPSGGSAVPRFQVFTSSHTGPRWVVAQRALDLPASTSRVRPVRSAARSSISHLSYAGVVCLLHIDSSALTWVACQFSLLFGVLRRFSTRVVCCLFLIDAMICSSSCYWVIG